MTNSNTADIVICGAGIAGISAAYQLAVKHDAKNIVIVDPLPPLTLTSDKSSESYRNWWPGPGDDMVRLMNRSIDIMEGLHREAPSRLAMHRRGYLYATGDPSGVEAMIANAEENRKLDVERLRASGTEEMQRFRAVYERPKFHTYYRGNRAGKEAE